MPCSSISPGSSQPCSWPAQSLRLPARAADLQKILSAGTVRIGVPIDVPPFGSVDAKNEPVGLDVDMANKIAEALGVKLELQQITGANRVPYLVTDRLDIVIAAMGATPERALQIAFTSPYAALSIGVFGPDSIAVTSPASSSDADHRGCARHHAGPDTDQGRARRQDHALRRRRHRRRSLYRRARRSCSPPPTWSPRT